MTIPVIILNYNASAECRKCVVQLERQTGVELELVVVDNASTKEGEREAVAVLCKEKGCTFIGSERNRGYNAGNNLGLRYASEKGYKYALIANPDMEFPQTDFVSRLVGKMEEDDDIAVCSGDIVGLDGIHQNPMKRDGDWKSSFNWLTRLFRRRLAGTDRIDNNLTSQACAKLTGCCFMASMNFIREIGFFDETPFLYCEEAILSRQVERAYKKMYYVAEAHAIHAHVSQSKGDPNRRFREWRRSRIYFIREYGGDSRLGKQKQIVSVKLFLSLQILHNLLKQRRMP